ncbi:hypothetical protein D9M68_239360 [compost metagenome]
MKATDASRTRRRMGDAKVALGERGPIWRDDGEPDLSRHLVKNIPDRSLVCTSALVKHVAHPASTGLWLEDPQTAYPHRPDRGDRP